MYSDRRFMKACKSLLWVSILASILILPKSSYATAGIFKQINFQGKVVNKTVGTNVTNGAYDFTFKLYDAASAGSLLWTENWTSANQITVTDGIFRASLGSITALPGSVDFNTDNLFLDITFNGETMTSRVQFTAVPYAFNARKVAGLTVTDTTGTFTLTAGKTLSVANTLSFAGTDGTTITFQGTDTYVGKATTDVLTNKTIGSTGLIFSGATTDIDTAGGEALILNGNAASAFNTSAGTISFQSGGTGTTSTIQIGAGGVGGTTPDYFGLDVKSTTGDPVAAGFEGAMYYNTFDNKFRCYQGAAWTDCIGTGSATFQDAYDNDADTGDTTITLSSTDDSIIVSNPTSSGTDSTFAFKINQQNTTANVSAMDIIQASTGANAVNITANSIQSKFGVAITADALTSGKGLTIDSAATAFTGSLQEITLSGSNVANTGSLLKISNTGTSNSSTSLYIDHRGTGTGNLAMRIDDSSGDTTPFVVDGDGQVGIGTSDPGAGLQVGSGTNRQDALVYGNIQSKGYTKRTALTNIKDVFVYDTTRDVDGGEWTNSKSAQLLTWYTETKDNTAPNCVLGTDDRCGRSNFPRKAIIVVTTTALHIFDAADNTLWMSFNQNSSGYALGIDTNNDPSSVFALNGVVYVGLNGSAAKGMYAYDFTQDRMFNYDTTDRSQGDKDISNRNTAVTYNTNNITKLALNNIKVNDVHGATIFGSSTQASSTFMPLNGTTFICAATDQATSVINMSSGVTLDYGPALTDQMTACYVTRRARLYMLNKTRQEVDRFGYSSTNSQANNIDSGTADNTTMTKVWDETTSPGPYLFKTAQTVNIQPDVLEVSERGSLGDELGDIVYVGHGGGMTEIDDVETSSATFLGLSKFYTKDFETGYMAGTPRGYFPFNEAAGSTTVADATIRNNVLAVKGSPTFGGVNGVHGTAMHFDNVNDYLCSDANNDGTCDQDGDFDPGTITFQAQLWFRHSTTAAADTIIDRTANLTVAGFQIRMDVSGTITGLVRDGTSTDTAGPTTQTFNDNQWHFLVLNKNSSGGLDLFIDGRYVAQDISQNATLTLSGATAMGIGASCTAVNCSTQANYWDGDIDDLYIGMGGSTSSDSLRQKTIQRMYNEGRGALSHPSTVVTDATSVSSTTIGDSGEAWTPQSFIGSIVEITEGTGAGQTRRVTANSSTVMTVSPAWTVAPDTTSDFEVQPEQLYGGTNTVTSIGFTDNTFVGDNKKLYVGTSDGSDGGGVTVFEGAGNSYATDVYHIDAGKSDNNSSNWSGTNSDNIQSISTIGTSVAIGTGNHLWGETDSLDLQAISDSLSNKIYSIKQELVVDTLNATAFDQPGLGGADLAENYYSSEAMEAGNMVMLDATQSAGIKKTTGAYQKGMLGIVSTLPGLTLGPDAPNAYPVALVGRVPVKVTTEGGLIKAGDYVTSSSLEGFGMRATKAGAVIGKALEDLDVSNLTDCSVDGIARSCGTVSVFINLTNTLGDPVDVVMADKASVDSGLVTDSIEGLTSDNSDISFFNQKDLVTDTERKTLAYLRSELAKNTDGLFSSQIFTDKVSALEIVSPTIFTDLLVAKRIKADSIEGLEIFTNKISKLETDMSLLTKSNTDTVASSEAQVLSASTDVTLEATLSPSMAFDGTLHGLKVDGEATISGGLTVWGGTIIDGVLNVLHSITTENIIIGKWADFAGQTLFRGDIFFMGRPEFNKDTAGTVRIKKDSDRVEIVFDKEYKNTPIVNTTLQLESVTNDDGTSEDLSDKEKSLIAADYKYFITNKSKKGFTIILNKRAQDDIQFSWTAFVVTDGAQDPFPKVSVSN